MMRHVAPGWTFILALIFALVSLGAQAQETAPVTAQAWGTRAYAVEKPLYDELVSALEAKIAAGDARMGRTAGERDAYWQDWSEDERRAARDFFERSTHYPATAKRLNWVKEERDAAAARYRSVLEGGGSVDYAADDDFSKARRERLWSTHLALLQQELAVRNEQAIYDGIELQAVKSYLGSLINRDLGIDLAEFARDSADDAWYVIRVHADKFWDEMSDCAAKLLVREGMLRVAAYWSPEFKKLPEVPGVVTTPEGVVAECVSDIVRNSIVNAFTAALRKNFVDDMTGQGIAEEVAEYWWAKFILAGESELGPNAKTVLPLRDRIWARLDKAYERALEQLDMEQGKEMMKRLLEMGAHDRLAAEVKVAALEAARQAQQQGGRLTQETLRLQSVQAATKKLGPELYAKDVSLRFLAVLDGAEMLFRQGYVAYSAIGSEMAFAEQGKPIIDEYWRVVRCLEATQQSTGAHMILQYYGWPEERRREFFTACGKIKEDLNAPEGGYLEAQMAGLAGLAANQISLLEQRCSDGRSALRQADASLNSVARDVLVMARSNTLVDTLTTLYEGIFKQAEEALSDTTALAEETEKLKKETEAAADKTCRLAEEIRASGDDADKRAKLDAAIAAEAEAVSRAADAQEAARLTGLSAKDAADIAGEAQDYAGARNELRSSAARIEGGLAEVESALASAADIAQAATKAMQDLADINRRATPVMLKARQLLGGPNQTEAIKRQLARIEQLYAVVRDAAASDHGCARKLIADINDLRAQLDKLRIDAAPHRATAEKMLAELDAEGPQADVGGFAAQARATADVAEAIAGAATSSAADARTCLGLARAATQGEDAELAAAGRAAIDQCDFVRAKDLIERLPAGQTRTDLASVHGAALAREKKTKALWEEADGLFAQGEFEQAIAKLDAALGNTACEDYKGKIVSGIARIRAMRDQLLEETVRAAIAECNFDDANQTLAYMEQINHPQAGAIEAALEAAMVREAEVDKLLAEADNRADYADNADIIAMLRQAQALTNCAGLQGQIATEIANLQQPAPDQDSGRPAASTPETSARGESGPAPVRPAIGTWEGPWRGGLRLQQLIVNGQPMAPQALAAAIGPEWQNYLGRRAGAGDPVSPMEQEIGGKVLELAKSGFMMLTGDLPVSFVFLPDAGGYRLLLPGAPPPGASDPVLLQFVNAMPVFQPDGLGGWQSTRTDKGSMIQLTLAAADASLSQLNLGLTLVFEKPADIADAGNSFNIRSLRVTLSGSAGPGETPFGQLVEDYRRLIRERRASLP